MKSSVSNQMISNGLLCFLARAMVEATARSRSPSPPVGTSVIFPDGSGVSRSAFSWSVFVDVVIAA